MEKRTFLMTPWLVPTNATVCCSVEAREIEVSIESVNLIAAVWTIGIAPEIFRPTSQKSGMFPAACNEKIYISVVSIIRIHSLFSQYVKYFLNLRILKRFHPDYIYNSPYCMLYFFVFNLILLILSNETRVVYWLLNM